MIKKQKGIEDKMKIKLLESIIAAILSVYPVGCTRLPSKAYDIKPKTTQGIKVGSNLTYEQSMEGSGKEDSSKTEGNKRNDNLHYLGRFPHILTSRRKESNDRRTIEDLVSNNEEFYQRSTKEPTHHYPLPDRIYVTASYSCKGKRFLKTAHESVKTQVERPLSLITGRPVDIKEWKDYNQTIITPGLALGWDINEILELFFEFSYGKGDLKTRGSSPNAFIPLEGFPGEPIVNIGPTNYKFNITRESTSIGLGPLVHIGDLVNRLSGEDRKWLGRGRFDPYIIAIVSYNWSNSDFESYIRLHGGDVSSQLGLPQGSIIVPPTVIKDKSHNSGRGPGLALGFGFNAPLWGNWDLTTTARYNWVHLDGRNGVNFDLDQWTVAIGLVYPIGGPKNKKRWTIINGMVTPSIEYFTRKMRALFK